MFSGLMSKYSLLLRLSTVGLLVVASLMFSSIFDSTDTYYQAGSTELAGSGGTTNCVGTLKDPELKALDPTEEDILSANKALVPAEVLSLNEGVEQFVKLHWEKVEGAKEYDVKAWQVSGGKKTMLLETRTTNLEARVEPKSLEGKVYWQVAGVDASGKTGEVAGPVSVDPLRKPAASH